ncbi:hypothetical protein SKAU_G00086360 [Synaphobranchus kaupii]|uniref:FAM21/CAPZIP domain-containing protein n=1 Tax=Synaphobranchus kaupii TaxID=118154 RepID=A0A9Q1FWN0_SYNKA|nr:hypothetical protein SKAU_G00086360 [Synaphobranchus kaupii]
MEKNSVSPSGPDHTGKVKGRNMLTPAGTEEVVKKPIRRRPPRTLQLNTRKPEEQTDEEKPCISSSSAPKVRPRSSPLIEKLQANLALTPTALIPTPKSPEVNLPPTPFSPSPALSPLAPPSPALSPPSPALVSEEEAPVSFEDPPEGTVLPSINKGRARLSVKRRPPTRQHRKSCGEEAGAAGGRSSPRQLDGQRQNEGGEEAVERTNRKSKRVRGRKSSGRDSGEGGTGTPNEAQPGEDEDSEETAAVTQEVKPAGDEAPAEPEGEGLPGKPCPEDRVRANRKEGVETRPQEEEGENAIGPDEDKLESTGD